MGLYDSNVRHEENLYLTGISYICLPVEAFCYSLNVNSSRSDGTMACCIHFNSVVGLQHIVPAQGN